MTTLIGILIVATVAWALALPLLRAGEQQTAGDGFGQAELWEREKNTALLAIKEADFDKATGKLTDGDHDVLTSAYRARALEALARLDRLASDAQQGRQASAATPAAAFCTACGRRFVDQDAFCGACGQRRA